MPGWATDVLVLYSTSSTCYSRYGGQARTNQFSYHEWKEFAVTSRLEILVGLDEPRDERPGERGEPLIPAQIGGDAAEHVAEEVLLGVHRGGAAVVPIEQLREERTRRKHRRGAHSEPGAQYVRSIIILLPLGDMEDGPREAGERLRRRRRRRWTARRGVARRRAWAARSPRLSSPGRPAPPRPRAAAPAPARRRRRLPTRPAPPTPPAAEGPRAPRSRSASSRSATPPTTSLSVTARSRRRRPRR